MTDEEDREAIISYWHDVNCRSHVALVLGRLQRRIERRREAYANGDLHINWLRQAIRLRIRVEKVTYTHDCGRERFMKGGPHYADTP